MKFISVTTTLLPIIALFGVNDMMQHTRVHGLEQEHPITRSRNLKSSKSKATKAPKVKKSATRALTMWWVIFNKPSECSGGSSSAGEPACALSDVMDNAGAGTNVPQIAIIHASGGIPNENGSLRMVASIYETQCDLDLVSSSTNGHYLWGGPPPLYANSGDDASFGLCPAEEEESEVHIVIRDHGPPTDDLMWQLTRFTDPSCSSNDGPNLCADVGAIGFGVSNNDVAVSGLVGGFPAFPEGCFKAGTCSEVQEAIQLRSGSKVTLIRTGSAYQVVAEIDAPHV